MKPLNEVDWGVLGVPKMPEWLEGMASHDFDTREEAYNAFYDSGIPNLHKATPHVIPFVIEFLASEDMPEQDSLLQLLIVLASEAKAYSDHPKLEALAKAVLAEIGHGKAVFEVYTAVDDSKELASELLSYI